MNESLREHLGKENYNLPKSVVEEVVAMFNAEAKNLLDSLSALKPEVRDVALRALRDYYSTMEQNNTTFTQVATVLAKPNGSKNTGEDTQASNDDTFSLAA